MRNLIVGITLLLLLLLLGLAGIFGPLWPIIGYVLAALIVLMLTRLFQVIDVTQISGPPPEFDVDHFKVYDVRDVPLYGELGQGRPVFTQGQFDDGPKPGTLLAVTHFANPAVKNLIDDPVPKLRNEKGHLTWYQLEQTVLEPPRRVTFTNQFGEDQKIVILQAEYLLLPTSKLEAQPPTSVPEDVDHYKCYRVIEEEDVTIGQTVRIEDQFGVDDEVVVGRPAYFCVPANKFLGTEASTPGLVNADDHLVAYEIPKTVGPIPPFKTKDQFQDYPGFEVITSEYLCVPTKKIDFEEIPITSPPAGSGVGGPITGFLLSILRPFLLIVSIILRVLGILPRRPTTPPTDADIFFDNLGTSSGFGTSVTPLVDAKENFPAVEGLINDAERFIYIVNLGVDEKTNLKHNTQVFQAGRPESEWLSIERAIKRRIENNTSPPLEVKILLWDTFVFADRSEYTGDFSDVGDVIYVEKRWGDVNDRNPANRTFRDFLTRIRSVSCARSLILEQFYNAYQGEQDLSVLPFPTGVEVAIEKHPTRSVFGSHHQKIILTDKGAWVAGLNLLKHHWDTQEHFLNDPNRFHSGEGPVFAGPNNLPWHDTGALVRGDSILRAILQKFSERWDTALRRYNPYTELQSVVANYSGVVAMYLNRRSVTEDSKFLGLGRPFNSTPAAPMVERSNIAVSLPSGTGAATSGVKEIREHYWRSIDAMEGERSFIYIETQFFTNHDLTKKLYTRWKGNVNLPSPSGGLRELDEPFLFVMIPYVPDPDLPDPSVTQGFSSMTEDEAQNLRWMEVKTARVIYVRDNRDHWVPHSYVKYPQVQIHFTHGPTERDPSELSPSSEFHVTNAIELNPDESFKRDSQGNLVLITFDKRADEVMTRGDIMAYTLITTRKRNGDTIRANTLGGSDVEDRLHEFLEPNHVYVHSKSSIFLNKQNGNSIATIGSANCNIRSFDDGGHQDSEMNVWWSGTTPVTEYRAKLWVHHLRLPNAQLADEPTWQSRGWQNMRKIMLASGAALEGDVVRLDVMDRLAKL